MRWTRNLAPPWPAVIITLGWSVFFGGSVIAASPPPRLQYVTTAHQFGPVGFRDPIGAVSPDGVWLAYGAGRELKVQRVGGGPVHTIGPMDSSIRYLAWLPDSRHVAVQERVTDTDEPRWLLLDTSTSSREPLLPGKKRLQGKLIGSGGKPGDLIEVELGRLRHLVWSPNGSSVAVIAASESGWQLWTFSSDGGIARVVESNKRLSFPTWTADGKSVACLSYAEGRQYVIFESSGPPGTKGLYIVPRSGGRPRRIHEFKSEQLYSGIGVSPDGWWVAFVQPASDGYFQIFRVPVEGGTPEQLTFDRSHKTQPSYAPNGKEIAFTVFVYESQFWLLEP
jgi:Tol biopolymer transport system component